MKLYNVIPVKAITICQSTKRADFGHVDRERIRETSMTWIKGPDAAGLPSVGLGLLLSSVELRLLMGYRSGED